MMEYKSYSPRTSRELQELSAMHGGTRVLSHLEPKELKSSASNWNIRHLIVYRLLVTPARPFLAVLRPNHDGQCPLCAQQDVLREQQGLQYAGANALARETPRNLISRKECELMQLPAGSFWVALARAAATEAAQPTRVYPQRERKQTVQEGYVDSRRAILGSSSPVQSSSASDFSMSDVVDEDEHEARRHKPEEVTVHLIISFLQHALQLFHCQDPPYVADNVDIRPRVERRTATARIANHVQISAEDDGGISGMRRELTVGWTMAYPYLALLEAKKAFKSVQYDDEADECIPIVSDETLAQCLGEAVVTWKESRDRSLYQTGSNDSIFLISATNTFMRLVHFRFGRDYLEYLDAKTEEEQSEIANDGDKDSFVYMSSTSWFNLQSCEGRRSALCCILTLLRWHIAKGSIAPIVR